MCPATCTSRATRDILASGDYTTRGTSPQLGSWQRTPCARCICPHASRRRARRARRVRHAAARQSPRPGIDAGGHAKRSARDIVRQSHPCPRPPPPPPPGSARKTSMSAVTGCDGACSCGSAARARARARARRRTAGGGGRLRRLRCARGAGSRAARAAPAGRKRGRGVGSMCGTLCTVGGASWKPLPQPHTPSLSTRQAPPRVTPCHAAPRHATPRLILRLPRASPAAA